MATRDSHIDHQRIALTSFALLERHCFWLEFAQLAAGTVVLALVLILPRIAIWGIAIYLLTAAMAHSVVYSVLSAVGLNITGALLEHSSLASPPVPNDASLRRLISHRSQKFAQTIVTPVILHLISLASLAALNIAGYNLPNTLRDQILKTIAWVVFGLAVACFVQVRRALLNCRTSVTKLMSFEGMHEGMQTWSVPKWRDPKWSD